MEFTNKFNLPDRVVRVIVGKYKYHEPELNRLSVTDLTGDPLIRMLYVHHHDLIVRDYSDMLTMVQGTALHDRYEMVATDDEDVEHKLEDAILDTNGNIVMIVVGKADSYFDETILDVKQTGCYGPKYRIDKWTKQLNVYAWQIRKRTNKLHQEYYGRGVKKLLIDVWYRDWKQNKTYYKDYSPIPFEVIELELWPFEKQDEYVRSQVQKHINHPIFDTPDKYTKPCSDKQRGIRFEAYKNKNKTPTRVGDTIQEVEGDWVDVVYAKGGKVNVVRSEPVFCNCYCKSRNICPFNKEKK